MNMASSSAHQRELDAARKELGGVWKQIAIHALHDLVSLGVDITFIEGVTDDVVMQVVAYHREQTAYS